MTQNSDKQTTKQQNKSFSDLARAWILALAQNQKKGVTLALI
jgi:hypothetical protein